MKDIFEINRLIEAFELELVELDARRAEIEERIGGLLVERERIREKGVQGDRKAPMAAWMPDQEKISLFRSLFRGREDVFPKRFEDMKTGRRGYAPCCRNEGAKGVCGKPEIECNSCKSPDFVPVSDKVIKSHFLGYDLSGKSRGDFSIGVYTVSPDGACWFLAADFDKGAWMEEASAYMKTCESFNVPAALERAGSDDGGRVWIFFREAIPAAVARKLGAFLLAETIERNPGIGLISYDRFSPSRNVLPRGGFGDFVALPFQKGPREKGNSVFLDENFLPYPDQWAFLASIQRMALSDVENIPRLAAKSK